MSSESDYSPSIAKKKPLRTLFLKKKSPKRDIVQKELFVQEISPKKTRSEPFIEKMNPSPPPPSPSMKQPLPSVQVPYVEPPPQQAILPEVQPLAPSPPLPPSPPSIQQYQLPPLSSPSSTSTCPTSFTTNNSYDNPNKNCAPCLATSSTKTEQNDYSSYSEMACFLNEAIKRYAYESFLEEYEEKRLERDQIEPIKTYKIAASSVEYCVLLLQKGGPFFRLNRKIRDIFVWRDPMRSASVLLIYCIACLYPWLFFTLPLVFLIAAMGKFYVMKMRYHGVSYSDQFWVPEIRYPTEEQRKRNMADVKNVMKLLNWTVNEITRVIKLFDWSDEKKTLDILHGTIFSLIVVSVALFFIPLRVMLLAVGCVAFTSQTPLMKTINHSVVNYFYYDRSPCHKCPPTIVTPEHEGPQRSILTPESSS